MTTLTGTPAPISVYNENTEKYLFGYPVWMQNKQYTFNLKAYEVYHYLTSADLKNPAFTDNVPTRDGLASIVNNLEDGGSSPDTLRLDSTGSAMYAFSPGAPELSDGVGRKGFSVSIKIGAQTVQWEGGKLHEGYVMGGRKPAVITSLVAPISRYSFCVTRQAPIVFQRLPAGAPLRPLQSTRVLLFRMAT